MKQTHKKSLKFRRLKISEISLLVSLLALIFTVPFLTDLSSHRLLNSFLLLLTFLLALITIEMHKIAFRIAIVLFVASFVGEIMLYLEPSGFLLEFHYIRKSVNFFFIAGVLFYYLMLKKTFTTSDILNAISIYLLVGISFGFLYCFLETLTPGSYHYAVPANEILPTSLFYFSYVSLATIGFGDISPVTVMTRLLAVFEAMFGLFYIAIIIGRMVGMTRFRSEEREE
jgi:voltage-gated potassium channel